MNGQKRATANKEYAYSVGKEYNDKKGPIGGDHRCYYTKVGSVSSKLSKKFGINRCTVIEYGAFAEGVDIAEDIIPGTKEMILHGNIKATKALICGIRKLGPSTRKRVVEDIVNGDLNDAKKLLDQKEESPKGDVLSKYGMVDDGCEIKFTSADLLQEITDNFKAYIHSLKKTISVHNDVFESDKEHMLEEISKLFNSAFKEFTEGM